MQKKIKPIIAIMLEEIAGIDKFTQNKTLDDYSSDWLLRHAIQRAIEIISEASRRLPDQLKEQHADVNWRQVHGIGNVLRHEYHNVRDQVIWDVVKVYLPPLKAALSEMRDSHSD